MKQFPLPANEEARLNKLAYYDLVNLAKDQDLDVFSEAASLITDCPVALIGVMERDAQTVQSCIGLDFERVDRRDTVCQYTVESGKTLVIKDTLLDERTSSNELILAGGIRFYAGIPLLDDEGLVLGTLCVIDFNPRTLTSQQVAALEKIGEAVARQLMTKRRLANAEYFEQLFSVTNNLICVLDNNFRVKKVNSAFRDTYEFKDEVSGINFLEILNENSEELALNEQQLDSNGEYSFVSRIASGIGETLVIDWFFKRNHSGTEIFCFGRNITQLVEDRQRLQRSEKRFRSFFENAIGLMSMHDVEGNILAVNEKGREMLQYTSEEARELNLRDLVPQSRWFELNEYLQRITHNGEDSGYMVLHSRDGQEFIWMYHNMVEMNEVGEPYVLSTALNVTDKMALEKDLVYTKKILEQTSAAARVGGWEVNLITQKTYWSDTTREIHMMPPGYQPDLNSALGFYTEESREKVTDLFNRAIGMGEPYDEELEMILPDGKRIWVRSIGIPEFENGVCRKVFGIIQDIDDAKRTYLELEKKEAMLQSFISDVPVAVAMFDQELRYLSVSRCWTEEFSMDVEAITGRNIFEVSPNIPAQRVKIYMDALSGKSYKNENLVVPVSNKSEPQNYSLEVGPWYLANEVIGGVIVTVQNVTERERTTRELRTAKEAAVIASKAKSEFLANMSHEIRTPLNGVIGFSDLLLRTPLNEMQTQYLNYINESGESLLSIINDILDFSKIESGKLELMIERTHVYDMVGQVMNVILFQSQKKDLELLLNIEPGIPEILLMDESRIRQILINLLGNAVKFTSKGEIELKVQKLHIESDHITLRFAVRDTGIGIPDDKQQRIFDAFTQEDSSVSKKYGGTGLGLTISNNILKYMGTSLSLKSTLGEGSEFYFDIEVPYEEGNAEEDEDIAELGIKSVLIVDDNENNRIILQHMLAYKGIDSRLAANGMEALQILMAGDRFDIILMDYHMPVISGLETITKIRELFKEQSEVSPLVVLHTSSEEHEVINSFRQNENSFCLLKPIKSKDLYNTLKQAVRHSDEHTAAPQPDTNEALLTGLKVLLVDDNPVNMVLNNRMMQSLVPEATFIEATDGKQALEYCRDQIFDLILMDVQMPVMDGIEATKMIRLVPDQKPVIIGVTAGNVLGEKEKCLAAGMDDFLTKPLRQGELLEALKTHIYGKSDEDNATVTAELHLDMKHLEEQMGEDEDFRNMFLNLVVQETEASGTALAEACQKGSVEEIKKVLHKLKGTAGTAGLFSLAEIAARWENTVERNPDYATLETEIRSGIMSGLETIKRLIK